jgi:hypothetical protein
MMPIQATDITDLVNSTLEARDKNHLADVATTLQSYPAVERLMNKKRFEEGGGTQYRFDLITNGDDNARAVGFFDVDDIDQVDGSAYGTVPWRFLKTGCHYDVKQLAVNSGARAMWKFIKAKEYQMWISWTELLEEYFWDGPASSADTLIPWGLLNYWMSYNASVGFNSGDHANWSGGPAGLPTATYAQWNHYSGQYTAVTQDDLLNSMRSGFRFTDFRGIPNKSVQDYADGVGHRFGWYTTTDNLLEMEDYLDNRSDGVRKDLAKWDGVTMFRRVPVENVPYLQENHATSDPVIGLDWNDFKAIGLRGMWMRKEPYHRAPQQSDVRQRFVKSSINYVMHNRRRHILLAKSDPMSD